MKYYSHILKGFFPDSGPLRGEQAQLFFFCVNLAHLSELWGNCVLGETVEGACVILNLLLIFSGVYVLIGDIYSRRTTKVPKLQRTLKIMQLIVGFFFFIFVFSSFHANKRKVLKKLVQFLLEFN